MRALGSGSSLALTAGDGVDVGFSSTSDALLSSFLLKHEQETKLDVFDSFFTLLHDPRFRSTEISFKKIEDIYFHIADRQRALSEKMLTPRATTTDVPALIVDFVADMLDFERLAFEELVSRIDDNLTMEPHALSLEETTLRSMSLVHRSWTRAAQRALRRRQAVVGLKGLHKVLRNPHIGPWVRELTFTSPTLTHYWSGYDGLDDLKEVSRLLLTLLELCPNVRKLHIKSCFKHKGPTSDFKPILLQIGNLKYLSSLWLTHYRAFYGSDDTPGLPTFFSVLPGSRTLKKLSLNGWSTHPLDDRLPDANELGLLANKCPTANLQSLSFTLPFHCEFQHTGLLSWLFGPRGNFALTNLEISCKDLFGMADWEPLPLFGVLLPSLPRLLRLRLLGCPYEVKAMTFLENCTALEHLTLVYADDFTQEKILLPSTLKSLQIHFTRHLDFQDENILKTISGSKHIKKLFVTATRQVIPNQAENQNVPEENAPRRTFAKTRKFCRKHNISFGCDVDLRLPAFFSEV